MDRLDAIISLNGQLLHEVRLPLPPHEHVRSIRYRVYPPREYAVRETADGLVVFLPALLVLELYRMGILTAGKDKQISVGIDGKDLGPHLLTDFFYPDCTDVQNVEIRLTKVE